MKRYTVIVALLFPVYGKAQTIEIDLMIINAARIETAALQTTANSIAINNGKIIAIADANTLKNRYKASRLIDLAYNGTIYPGFIDAHCHFTGQALDAYKCSLFGVTSETD